LAYRAGLFAFIAGDLFGTIVTVDTPSSAPPDSHPHDRWAFFRDVLVFQVKLLLDNLRDFALVPVSLVAALIDLVVRGERQGTCFYKVLEWGAHSERVIDVYSALDKRGSADSQLSHNYTVDSLISKVEGVIVREYEKGGTAASVKLAVDRALDQLQIGAGDRAKNIVNRAADKMRTTVGPLPPNSENTPPD
jgi:hypothetical protein